jgi:hypothetical protein
MTPLIFRKRFEFADAPAGWRPVNAALDWSGNPLLLMVEGKGDSRSYREDPEAWSRWYRTPPKAHHLIYWDGRAMQTLPLEHSQGISSFHIQRFREGWLLGEQRGGRTLVYDQQGSLTATLDLGDASEDLQTTPDGKIWVSYFDEGVFGKGLGAEGAICFDSAGSPVFRFAEFATKYGLPMIADCYAMNVTPEGEVWLNYYTDFPLVRLRDFALEHLWQCAHPMGKAFAVRGPEVLYLHDGRFRTSVLEQLQEQQTVMTVDEHGAVLSLDKEARPVVAARGSMLIVKTETALYELIQ